MQGTGRIKYFPRTFHHSPKYASMFSFWLFFFSKKFKKQFEAILNREQCKFFAKSMVCQFFDFDNVSSVVFWLNQNFDSFCSVMLQVDCSFICVSLYDIAAGLFYCSSNWLLKDQYFYIPIVQKPLNQWTGFNMTGQVPSLIEYEHMRTFARFRKFCFRY